MRATQPEPVQVGSDADDAWLSGDSPWFGDYQLTHRVATGGMAEVFAARRKLKGGALGPKVALKRLLPHAAFEPMIVQMFLNEARITAQVAHPNVVRILDLGLVDDQPYLAMELLEGCSFAALRGQARKSGGMPVPLQLRILVDACRGLHAAHVALDHQGKALAVVHRDFTPANIHVSVDGGVKLIDFGIAKAANLSAGTQPGVVKGKLAYVSPEMLAGQPVDQRADVYAAGVMLYEILTGRRPHLMTAEAQLVRAVLSTAPPDPRSLDPSIPVTLEAPCLKAIDREPEHRLLTVAVLADAIEAQREWPAATTAQLAEWMAAHHATGDRDERARVTAVLRDSRPTRHDRRRLEVPDGEDRTELGRDDPRTEQVPASAPTTEPHRAFVDAPPTAPGSPPAQSHAAVVDPVPAAPAAPPTSVAPGSVEPAPLDPSAPALRPKTGWRRPPWLSAAAIGVAGLIAAAALVALLVRGAPPAERLARARAVDSGEERAKLLDDLDRDARAGPGELKAAQALLAESGEWETAARMARRAAALEPGAAALLDVAKLERLSGHSRLATQALDEAAAAGTAGPLATLLRVELLLDSGDVAGARAALIAALDAGDEPSVRARLVRLEIDSGELETAEALLPPPAAGPLAPELRAELAHLRLAEGRITEAFTAATAAAEALPGSWSAQLYLGQARVAQGLPATAQPHLEQAVKLSPDDPAPLLAWCRQEDGETDPASIEALLAGLRARFRALVPDALAVCAR